LSTTKQLKLQDEDSPCADVFNAFNDNAFMFCFIQVLMTLYIENQILLIFAAYHEGLSSSCNLQDLLFELFFIIITVIDASCEVDYLAMHGANFQNYPATHC